LLPVTVTATVEPETVSVPELLTVPVWPVLSVCAVLDGAVMLKLAA
jgi:hypothetical protein